MKIIVVTGSPNIGGTSDTLAENFIRGAKEKGHDIIRYDAGRMELHPCMACYRCSAHNCGYWKDDMNEAIRQIMTADVIVFSTPIYYYQMSSQLKTFIDRFHCVNGPIKTLRLRSVMMAAAWNTASDTMDAISTHYRTLVKYLRFENIGEIYATGCTGPSDLAYAGYDKQAYELGKSI